MGAAHSQVATTSEPLTSQAKVFNNPATMPFPIVSAKKKYLPRESPRRLLG